MADDEEERGGVGGGGGGGGGWGSQPSSSEDSFTMSVASSDVGRIIGTGLMYVCMYMWQYSAFRDGCD